MAAPGPLAGVQVVELAGIGPGPFAAMMLADLGADVVCIDRPTLSEVGVDRAVLARGRRSVVVDLKRPEGPAVVRRLGRRADVVLEGLRPGVAERLGVGPEQLLAENARLVYARVTGWGQHGPLARRAGHDLDYVALAGALHPIGAAAAPPPPPLNYVGDFGGGGMLLVVGVLAALLERARSGKGQVVDAAIVDGAALQTAMVHGWLAAGLWTEDRAANLLDGAAPFYRCYTCADGKFVAVGALEPAFYAALLEGLGLDVAAWPQHDRDRWPSQAAQLAAIFAGRDRDEWAAHFAGSDACVVPVLSLSEAPAHPHAVARNAFVEIDGVVQPAPAPRFSRTPPGTPRPPVLPGQHTDAVLVEAGYSAEDVAALRADGAVQ